MKSLLKPDFQLRRVKSLREIAEGYSEKQPTALQGQQSNLRDIFKQVTKELAIAFDNPQLAQISEALSAREGNLSVTEFRTIMDACSACAKDVEEALVADKAKEENSAEGQLLVA